jgi:cell division protein FtsW
MPAVNQRGDKVLWILTLLLVLIGVMMIYSASNVIAFKKFGTGSYFLIKQMVWVSMGTGMLWAISRIPYRVWQGWVVPLTIFILILLGMVLIPGIGQEINGARRWFRIGPVVFQPSEFAKLAMVIYLAHYLTRGPEKVQGFVYGLLPALVVTGLGVLLILLEPDLGTAVTLALVALVLLFIGGARVRHLLILCLCALPVLAYLILGTEYRRQRWLTYLDPWHDPSDTGFQIIQSFLAFGSGGEIGVGLGEGRQKLFFLPYPHTDFIFSVIGEELGLVGTLLILFCFALLVWRGLKLACWVADPFGQFLAVGITLMIGLAALMNLGVVTGLLPTKGLPLPFVSYGGSSLLVNMIGMGILLSISRTRDIP